MIEDGQVYNPYKIFFGCYIPNWLMRTREVSPAAKLLWGLLVRHAGKDGICYPGYEILNKETGYGVDNIGKQIKELQNAKLIRVIKSSGKERLQHRNNRYEFIWNSDIIEKNDLYDNTGPDPEDNTGPDPEDNTGPYNNINIINNINKESIKDSLKGFDKTPLKENQKFLQKKDPPNFIKPQTGEYAVLCSWNKLPSPAHAHTKLSTKTVKHVAEFIRQMRNGIFGDPSRRKWDGGWLDKHKIDQKKFAEKKWTIREICWTIEGPLTDMYKDGYWPQSKDRLPKSLVDAFYNSRTQTSFFIQAYYDSPGKIKVRSKTGQDPYPLITTDLATQGVLQLDRMRESDWRQYHEGIKSLVKYLDDIDWGNYGAGQIFKGGRSGNPYSLIMQYVKWMKGDAPDIRPPRSIPERLHVGMVRSDFWAWQEFMISVNRYWKGVFRSIPYEES